MNVALPKGHLQAGVLDRPAEAGYNVTFAGDRDYHPRCNVSSVTAKMFKARAIPQHVIPHAWRNRERVRHVPDAV
jgi:hypothetical protein